MVELLAPAGSIDAFKGALRAGADAIYLAGNRFGARAYADNFTQEELITCIEEAHAHGKKINLTVNTLTKNAELSDLHAFLDPLDKANLDAVIVQDLGVMAFIREHFPSIELHASTQMTITGAFGARMLSRDFGVSRIVPARELSLKEIKAIKEKTGLELEVFIHGAMCYCYSGQCLYSSFLGDRSGNRGRCAQPCRLPYKGKSNKEIYPLSLKDLCTIEYIPELIDAGIDSFKIEGRMKSPEYAAGVTAAYRYVINQYVNNGVREIPKEIISDLEGLYLRSERGNGYLFKHNGKDMITMNAPSYNSLNEKNISKINKKYLSDEAADKFKIPVKFKAFFEVGKPARLELLCKNECITVTGDIVSFAENRPISIDDIKKVLLKIKNTPFSAVESDIDVTIDNNIFYSLKLLGDLRRNAILQLEEQLRPYRVCKSAFNKNILSDEINTRGNGKLRVLIRTNNQAEALLQLLNKAPTEIDRIYLEESLVLSNPNIISAIKTSDVDLFIALVYVRRLDSKRKLDIIDYSKKVDGFLVRNLEDLGFIEENGLLNLDHLKIQTDAGLYSFNDTAVKYLNSKSDGQTVPLELTSKELMSLKANNPEKIVYGKVPMMVTANCISRTLDKCQNKSDAFFTYLEDRKDSKLPVMADCNSCSNIIFNSVVLSLHRRISLYKNDYSFRLDFSDENYNETTRIVDYYISLKNNNYEFSKNMTDPVKEYTTGHEKRETL